MSTPNATCRIRLRAVLAGTLIAVSLMLFLTASLRSIMVDQDYGPDADPVGFGYWFAMIMVWIFSVSLGATVATLSSRAVELMDGVLQGLSTWSLSYLIVGVFAAVRNQADLPVLDPEALPFPISFGDFTGDLIALIVAMGAGFLTVYWSQPKALTSLSPARPQSPPPLATPALST